jgi:uncharacterized membrane protein YiaA
MNQTQFSVRFQTGTVGNIVLDPCLLPSGMTVQECGYFFSVVATVKYASIRFAEILI